MGGGERGLAELIGQDSPGYPADAFAENALVDHLWLQQMIAQLSVEQRTAIALLLHGLEFAEIAEQLSKSEGACRQAYKRGIAALRRMVREIE